MTEGLLLPPGAGEPIRLGPMTVSAKVTQANLANPEAPAAESSGSETLLVVIFHHRTGANR